MASSNKYKIKNHVVDNRSSSLLRRLLVALVLLLSIGCVAANAADILQSPAAISNCPPPKSSPKSPVFRDLKQVAIYVWLPGPYEGALLCHGREQECLDANGGLIDFPEKRPAVLKELQELYSTIPPSLYPEQLGARLKAELTQQLIPFVASGDNCIRPEIEILAQKNLWSLERKPQALTVVLKVNIFDYTKPKIAVLETYYYRPEPDHTDLGTQVFLPNVTAIPLDLSNDEINALTAAYFKRIMILTDA